MFKSEIAGFVSFRMPCDPIGRLQLSLPSEDPFHPSSWPTLLLLDKRCHPRETHRINASVTCGRGKRHVQ